MKQTLVYIRKEMTYLRAIQVCHFFVDLFKKIKKTRIFIREQTYYYHGAISQSTSF